MVDDPIDNLVFFDKGDHFHLSTTSRADQGIDLIDLADHGGPAQAGNLPSLILDDRPEVAVVFLEAALVFGKEPVEVMEEHHVESGSLWM